MNEKEAITVKKYMTPDMEITAFEAEDVITTSGENYDPSNTDTVTPEISF